MIRRSALLNVSLSCWLTCLCACSDAGNDGAQALSEEELSKRRANAGAAAPGGRPDVAKGGTPNTAQPASNPRAVEGNPSSCAAVIPEADGLLTYKVDPAKSGTYTSRDGGVTVSIDASEKTFSFTSDVPLAWVIVKGGPGANIYAFQPPVMAAEGLVAPNGKGLSHLDFCYPPPGGGTGGGGAGTGGSSSGGTSSGGTSTGGTDAAGAGGADTAGAAGDGSGGCDGPCQL